EDIARRDLALTLRDHPVLDANEPAGMWIGPTSDVARGKDSWRTRFEIFVTHDAAIHSQSSLLSESERRLYSHSQDEKISIEHYTATQRRVASVDAGDRFAQVEDNTLRFVQSTNEPADLRAHHLHKRLLLGGNDVNGDASCAQGRSDFESDEAGAHDDDLFRGCSFLGECPTVGKRAKVMKLRVGC